MLQQDKDLQATTPAPEPGCIKLLTMKCEFSVIVSFLPKEFVSYARNSTLAKFSKIGYNKTLPNKETGLTGNLHS